MMVGGKEMSIKTLGLLLTLASSVGALLFSMVTWAGAINIGPGERMSALELRQDSLQTRQESLDSLVEGRLESVEKALNGIVISECLDAEKAFRLTLAGINCSARLEAIGMRQ